LRDDDGILRYSTANITPRDLLDKL
jgi:hypothetical protein